MGKIGQACCKLCQGKEVQYQSLIKNLYPKHDHSGAIQNIGKFTMYAILNYDKLTQIGKIIETRIKGELKKQDVGYVDAFVVSSLNPNAKLMIIFFIYLNV